jgi:hypothetical protein
MGLSGAIGIVGTATDTYLAATDRDWDRVAYNAGNIVGGSVVGYNMGRGMVNRMQGYESAAPKFNLRHPIRTGRAVKAYEKKMGYNPKMKDESRLKWMGSCPTPLSGGFSVAGIGGGTVPTVRLAVEVIEGYFSDNCD